MQRDEQPREPPAGGEAPRDHFRRHERRLVKIPGMLRDRSGGFGWRVQVADLGLGGAGVEAGAVEAVLPGHPIVLEIVAPTLWDPLTVRGSVAWIAPSGRLGVRFDYDDSDLVVAVFEVLGVEGFG